MVTWSRHRELPSLFFELCFLRYRYSTTQSNISIDFLSALTLYILTVSATCYKLKPTQGVVWRRRADYQEDQSHYF
jgi:hypothetical protein